MAIDFDAITLDSLREVGGLKWSRPDTIGAFIAEMDFGIAPQITAALTEQIAYGRTGYPGGALISDLRDAAQEWLIDRFGWHVPTEHFRLLPDVLSGLGMFLRHFVPDGPLIVATPAYMPFVAAPIAFQRDIIEVPLARDGDRFVFDLDAIDAAFRAGARVFILCNPFNPVGRVFERAELEALCEVVERHGGRVFNDEIHAPVVYEPNHHIPYPTINEAAARHTITAMAASKAWNLPGLRCAQLVISNPDDVAVWDRFGTLIGHGASNPGMLASTIAYRHGREWLAEILDYLSSNRDLLIDLMADALPEVRLTRPEGTYLSWVDFSAYELPSPPGQFFAEHAKVRFTEGTDCGQVGVNHVRFNFATTKPILTEIVARLADAIAKR